MLANTAFAQPHEFRDRAVGRSTVPQEAGTELIFLLPRNHPITYAFSRFTDERGLHEIETLGAHLTFSFDSATDTLAIRASSSTDLPHPGGRSAMLQDADGKKALFCRVFVNGLGLGKTAVDASAADIPAARLSRYFAELEDFVLRRRRRACRLGGHRLPTGAAALNVGIKASRIVAIIPVLNRRRAGRRGLLLYDCRRRRRRVIGRRIAVGGIGIWISIGRRVGIVRVRIKGRKAEEQAES